MPTREAAGPGPGPGRVDEQAVRGALRQVIDPELGGDIVELGMLGAVTVDESGAVDIELLLTIAACPMRGRLRQDVEAVVSRLPGVSAVDVRTGVLDAEGRRRVMDRARRRAQDRALETDLPAGARVLAVSSGKGGVGKSSISVNLAVALARSGATVGILDADISGFSVPRLLGVDGRLSGEAGRIVPLERTFGAGSVRVVSMGFLSDERTAVMWRGLVLNRAVQQFLEDVRWAGVDHLVVDMPPGTGDIQMGLARMVPRTEVIVVTTPPIAAQTVAVRAADMARRGHLRVAGVIENMGPFTCDHGQRYALFGDGGGRQLADALGVSLLGSVPLDPSLAAAGDLGEPVAAGTGPLADVFAELARRVLDATGPDGRGGDMEACSARLLQRVEAAVAHRDVSGTPTELPR